MGQGRGRYSAGPESPFQQKLFRQMHMKLLFGLKSHPQSACADNKKKHSQICKAIIEII
jgi:hypothetical protein